MQTRKIQNLNTLPKTFLPVNLFAIKAAVYRTLSGKTLTPYTPTATAMDSMSMDDASSPPPRQQKEEGTSDRFAASTAVLERPTDVRPSLQGSASKSMKGGTKQRGAEAPQPSGTPSHGLRSFGFGEQVEVARSAAAAASCLRELRSCDL